MIQLKKKHYFLTALILLAGFSIPLLLKPNAESWSSTFSLSFTIVGALGTIATLIIAILLYDRFGSSAKFKEKQADAVIELASVLKRKEFKAITNKMTYNLPAFLPTLKGVQSIANNNGDGKKALLIPELFFESHLNQLYFDQHNYWLPEEIKDKIKFLDILATFESDDYLSNQYARLSLKDSEDAVWGKTVPQLTLEMFIINYITLLSEIESWLRKYSPVLVNLGFNDVRRPT